MARRDASIRSGLQDPEIEDLHTEISSLVESLNSKGIFNEKIVNTGKLFSDVKVNRFVRAGDEGEGSYYRVYLGRGTDANDPLAESTYMYEIHGFFYPGEGGKLDRIVFQFSRLIYQPGASMVREVRRITHRRPPVRPEESKSASSEKNGNDIEISYYRSEDQKSPFRESADGVPLPESGGQALMQFSINQKEEPVPYENRVRVVRAYKKLLGRSYLALRMQKKLRELDRPLLLNRALDVRLP